MMKVSQIRVVVYSLSAVVLVVLLFVMLTERETSPADRVLSHHNGRPLTTLRRDELSQAAVSTPPDVDPDSSTPDTDISGDHPTKSTTVAQDNGESETTLSTPEDAFDYLIKSITVATKRNPLTKSTTVAEDNKESKTSPLPEDNFFHRTRSTVITIPEAKRNPLTKSTTVAEDNGESETMPPTRENKFDSKTNTIIAVPEVQHNPLTKSSTVAEDNGESNTTPTPENKFDYTTRSTIITIPEVTHNLLTKSATVAEDNRESETPTPENKFDRTTRSTTVAIPEGKLNPVTRSTTVAPGNVEGELTSSAPEATHNALTKSTTDASGSEGVDTSSTLEARHNPLTRITTVTPDNGESAVSTSASLQGSGEADGAPTSDKSPSGQGVDVVHVTTGAVTTVGTTENPIEVTQRQRKQLLNDYCDKHNKRGISNKGDYYHLLVNEKHKIIYCYTPKVGCTQWLKIMGTLKGLPDHIVNPDPKLRRDSPEHDKIHERGMFRFLDSYPVDQAHKMLEEYTTFFFVREPFERLLSAYRDKFNLTYWPGAYYRGIASGIMRVVRPGASKEDLRSGLGLTFEEFTRYIKDRSASSWDHHWGLYDDICRPCKINYDFIGHFENMDQEGPYILEKAGVDHLVSANFKPSKTSSRLITYYSQIPKKRIERIADLSRSNFEMFGYEYPGPLKELLSSDENQ